MGKIKYVQGDLIKMFKDGDVDCIAHQCNLMLQSEFCGGIAGTIFKNFKDAGDANNSFLAGKSITDCLGRTSGTQYVFNIYSQIYTGCPNNGADSMECRLSYLKEGLNTIKLYMGANNQTKLGIPLIASGLAKQQNMKSMPDLSYFKKFILPVVKDVFKHTDITVIVAYL